MFGRKLDLTDGKQFGRVARISPCYRGRNGSLMPIGHKGRFLLMVKMQKNKTEITEVEQ